MQQINVSRTFPTAFVARVAPLPARRAACRKVMTKFSLSDDTTNGVLSGEWELNW